MYKILISDFENTLIDEEDAIPLSTMLSIDRIRNNNIKYILLSKKNIRTLLDYNRDFPFVDYIIVFNGAYVYDVNKNKDIYNKNIGISIVKKINKLFDKYNLCFYTLDWCNYTKEKVDGEYVRKIGDFKTFSTFHKNNIYKIEIRCKSKKEQMSILKELESLNLKINIFTRKDNDYFLEVVSSQCSRVEAVNKICKKEKVKLNEAVVVGSDEDNISLFKKVGMTYATANSCNKLKKVAKEITVYNYEKAVEKVIKCSF